ncbi:hypothetical protein BTO14_04965 [Polaribacter butkevichii]|uniref:FAS1 domain-containing protein n=2 Tax=Polaribacter butkevichii TaxID=218490 RepID=A0A2P6CCK4_9FLAO|nr:hypothetical protein BTO14_04965 [Polaribacter butkevichii]
MGCDLKVQESFVFDPGTSELFTFGAKTPWEWIQTNPGNEYNYLIEAIKHAGLEEEFSNTTSKRTYFLVKDDGWNVISNSILNKEFGSNSTLIADTDPVKLRNILLYYIVPQYIDQGPGLLQTLDVNYEVKTLSKDPINNFMTLRRDWNYAIGLNYSEDLPSTSMATPCRLHNYIFSNGNSVAHILTGHARIAPFE